MKFNLIPVSYKIFEMKTNERIFKEPSHHHGKENKYGMVNSLPSQQPEHHFHNTVKIDNYQGKRFKTQTGFEPVLTSSRYEGYMGNQRMHQSQEHYQECEQRPLTFGYMKQSQPMKSSLEYREDRKIKNQVLDQITKFRKNHQNHEYKSQDGGDFEEVKCSNHQNKKAKYKLITDRAQDQSQQIMVYCSKCAINLLQQGFKVEELRENLLKKSKAIGNSRLRDMRKFQQKLLEMEDKIQRELKESQELLNMEKDFAQTQQIYEMFIDMLQQMRANQLRKFHQQKQQKILEHEAISSQVEEIVRFRKQLKDYRNKFVIMKDQDFQYLISSFFNKIQGYGLRQSGGCYVSPQQKISIILSNITRALQPEENTGEMQVKKPFRTLFSDDVDEQANEPSFKKSKRYW